ncbi:hypothetical protein TGRH88_076930 [Toxoplasma gondii]|uniref:Transmembrane protein n=1 Tax=Toxoplasma gondii TaxID=5811 RepID=A0A7J6K5W6_TOXGO|nr:hypothetical protein TGRH88_076930 [Toxoplasma gondii]
MLYEISSGNVYIDACTDTCREMWQGSATPWLSRNVVSLFAIQTNLHASQLRTSCKKRETVAANMFLTRRSGIVTNTHLITLIVSLAAAFTYAIGQNAAERCGVRNVDQTTSTTPACVKRKNT